MLCLWSHHIYENKLDISVVYQCLSHSCVLEGFYLMIIFLMIMIIMMIMIIQIMILYTFLYLSYSSHETYFQEWHCEFCDRVFHFKRNYECHKEICWGVNMYQCQKCGKIYKNKRSLCDHRRKHHTDDVCGFTFFWCIM